MEPAYSLFVGGGLLCLGLAGAALQRHLLSVAVSLAVALLGVGYSAAAVEVWRPGEESLSLALVCAVTGAVAVTVVLCAGLLVIRAWHGPDVDAPRNAGG